MIAALFSVAILGTTPVPTPSPRIPSRPEQLVFEPIVYTPPKASEFRVVLKNGMVVFIAEDRTLPLVNIVLTIRTGSYLDPRGKEGLAALTGSQMRRGGAGNLTAEALDERLDLLAAEVSTSFGGTSGFAHLNCLKDNLDESLKLFVAILKEPRFEEDRLGLAREQILQEMKKRNDDAADISSREWNVLIHGEEHFTNRFTTEASIKAIGREDLVSFHRSYVHPASIVAAVSGSFARAEMLQKLEEAFDHWPGTAPAVPPVPSETAPSPPGLYRIQKDVNQGRLSLGLPTVRRDSPDVYALEVMNEILGGSGFTSRITRRVRSNEGLAYSAGSSLTFSVYYPGAFRASLESKSRSVAYATALVLEEIRRIRESPVTPQELDTIKKSLIETFPSNFASKAQAMGIFASDEYTHRDPEYWSTYRDRIKAVTAEDVLRVARGYLVLEKMIALVVGDQKEIDIGDGAHPPLTGLGLGPETALPLRDPMTMKRP
jgi:zinc protease